jgi:hypothetical protein
MDPRIRIHTKMPWIRNTAFHFKVTFAMQSFLVYMDNIDDTYSGEFRPMDQFETEVTGLHPGTDYQIRNAVSLSWHNPGTYPESVRVTVL